MNWRPYTTSIIFQKLEDINLTLAATDRLEVYLSKAPPLFSLYLWDCTDSVEKITFALAAAGTDPALVDAYGQRSCVIV